ncbi:MAG: ATP-grasp domain-containing protein [Neisseriaceae bacterium]|nr:MAG: ATP-grasp domain-containing protein [Neisseriaceae bacterium]
MNMSTKSQHLLLIAGIGGHTLEEAVPSLLSITNRISILYIDIWKPSKDIQKLWGSLHLDGELIIANSQEEAIAEAYSLNIRIPIDGVITYSELLLKSQALIIEHLNLPGTPYAAIEIAQSKILQRVLFEKVRVASPCFAIINKSSDIEDAVRKIGLPALFKPSQGMGSVGVYIVKNLEEVYKAFNKLSISSSIFLETNKKALLEEILPLEGNTNSLFANYVSVESLLVNGKYKHLVITDRARLCHGYIEEGLIMPSHLPSSIQSLIIKEAEKAISAIGLTHGAVHTEIAIVGNKPMIIEVNARAGGPIPSMLLAASGYDYAIDIALSSLNIETDSIPHFSKIAWHRFIPIPQGEWKVISYTLTEKIMDEISNIVYFSPRFLPGEIANKDRTLHLASFAVIAENIDDALKLVKETEDKFNIRLESINSF